MEKSCDSFWKWGNARKKMAFAKTSSSGKDLRFPVEIDLCKSHKGEANCTTSPISVIPEAQPIQLQSWCANKETRNSGVSEPTSSNVDCCCKIPKTDYNMIANGSFEIHKENLQSFAALNMLADVAVCVLENGYKGEDKEAKASSEQWEIFKPTRVPLSHKIVIRRAKRGGLKCVSSELRVHALSKSSSPPIQSIEL